MITGDEAFRKHIVEERGFSEAVADHHISLIKRDRRIQNPNLKNLDEPKEKPKSASTRKKTTKPRKKQTT